MKTREFRPGEKIEYLYPMGSKNPTWRRAEIESDLSSQVTADIRGVTLFLLKSDFNVTWRMEGTK